MRVKGENIVKLKSFGDFMELKKELLYVHNVLGPGLRTFIASASYIVFIVEAKRFCKALVLKYFPCLLL